LIFAEISALKRSTYFFLILILGSLTALGPFTIDMYLPGFGAIAEDLHTDVSSVGLTLSSYFIGISAGQLLYGPLLDRFGRKKPLYIGLLAYILASIGCVLTQNIDQFIVLRFFQAIGSCAATVAAMAMVRDIFPVNENAKVFALLMLVVGASPMIAPTAGGYVTTAFGWHAVFIILTVMGILMLLASIFWLPESYRPDTTMSLRPGPIIRNFWQVMKEPQFYTYTLTGAIAFSALFAYVSASPKVFMDVHHVDKKTFGWIFAALSVGFIGSSQVNTLALRRFTSEQILPVALGVQSLVGLFFIFGVMNGWLDLWGTLALLFVLLCCLGFVNPNTAALSLAPFERNAGSASSLMGALQMGVGALASVFVSLDEANSAMPLALVMTAAAMLALAVLLVCRRAIGSAETAEA
jgi:MFS transporter, DHA1 family, multidrug resistance protein